MEEKYRIAQDMWSRGMTQFKDISPMGQVLFIERFGKNIEKEINEIYNNEHKRWDLEMKIFLNPKKIA